MFPADFVGVLTDNNMRERQPVGSVGVERVMHRVVLDAFADIGEPVGQAGGAVADERARAEPPAQHVQFPPQRKRRNAACQNREHVEQNPAARAEEELGVGESFGRGHNAIKVDGHGVTAATGVKLSFKARQRCRELAKMAT